MNIFKTITAFFFCLIAPNILCWEGELVELAKGNKSVAFMIRYYDRKQIVELDFRNETSRKDLDLKDFYPFHRSVGIKIDGPQLLIAGYHSDLLNHSEIFYETCKRLLNSTEKNSAKDLIFWHYSGRLLDPSGPSKELPVITSTYNKSGLIVIFYEHHKEYGQKILNLYKSAMKKLAEEDAAVTYKEICYENGKVIEGAESRVRFVPSSNFFQRLKNFVWNEKFLYAMSALSALYLGYEYLKQN